MDRSIDSIGSCSLDADSTDFSDTSESLNFISPSATRENFTSGIAERVKRIQTTTTQPLTPKLILNQPVNNNNSQRSATTTTTAYFDINSGKISTIVSRDTNGCYFNGSTEKFLSTKTIELQSPTVVAHANKKPSYLNLACCVNGYSNYTNYDSVERKEINKSRDVSPIRPIITMSRQPRSSDNLLSIPQPVTFVKQSPLSSITKRFASLNINDSSGKDTTDNVAVNGNASSRKSFIQQRVEKLYGNTKILTTTTTTSTVKNSQTDTSSSNHHVNGNGYHMNGKEADEKENDEYTSLPVMKHLSNLRPEFCRQLQFLNSPKKTAKKIEPQIEPKIELENRVEETKLINSINPSNDSLIAVEEQNLKSNSEEIVMENCVVKRNIENMSSTELEKEKIENNNNIDYKNMEMEAKDGHYFLRLLNDEKSRILKLADETEAELQALQSDPSTAPSEDIVGVVLSAIGKSRLLATKKFKQFEGLCHENLTPNTDGPQTLSGDLQGFWDMMMLQVENVDAAFADIKQCRENGWKKPEPPSPQAPKGSRLTKRPLAQTQNNKVKKTTTTASSEIAQKREEQRKKLLEMKRKHKAAMQQNGSSDAEVANGDEKKENGIDMAL